MTIRWAGVALLLLSPAAFADPLRVHFFDVGQGDAALVLAPGGKALLIDAGPAANAVSLKRRVQALHPGPLDEVLLTHSHLDHLGGLTEVLGAVGAKELIDSGFSDPSPARETLDVLLHEKGVALRNAIAGDDVDLGGGAKLTFLSPSNPFVSGTRSDAHANSVVARLDFDRVHLLFMGDAEAETETKLLSAKPSDLRADVIKVGRHGASNTCTEAFLKQVHPGIAIISVGAGNGLDEPSGGAIARLTQAGAKVFRTDLDGELVLTSDGVHVSVAPVPPPPPPSPTPVEPAHPAGRVVASKHPNFFHTPECPTAKKLKPNNKLVYPNRDAALRAGKTPAHDCNP